MEPQRQFQAQRLLSSGVRLVQVAYPAHETLVRTDCPDLQLWWVLRGGWTLEHGGQSTELAAGSPSVHLPAQPCRQRVARGGATLLSVQVPARYGPAATLQPAPLILARLQVALSQGEPTLVLEDTVAALFGERTEPQKTRWLRRVRERLHAEFRDPPTLAALALDAGVHEVYLAASFRARVGVTIGEYVRRLRLEAALERLLTTNDDIATVAAAVGFYDHAHLTRLFRARVGLPPAAFRQLNCVQAEPPRSA